VVAPARVAVVVAVATAATVGAVMEARVALVVE
jgi:hypothetical protein